MPRVDEVLGHGENKASAKVGREGLAGGRARAAARKLRRGHAVLHRQQGSQRRHAPRAVKMGLKLSEYGLFRVEDDSKVAGETEEGVYEALGLAGFRRSCAKTAAKSKRPPKAACPNWWS